MAVPPDTPSPSPPPIAPPILPPPVIDPNRREVALDEQGNITEDLECRSCGYNLQGLPPNAQCPECSMSIARSIRGDELRFCDPAWVGSLALGMRLILIGIFSTIGFGILFIVGMIIFVILSANTTGAPAVGALTTGAGLLSLPMLLAIFGVWRVTTPDPGQIETEPTITARKLARWCIMVSLVSIPLEMMGANSNLTFNPTTALSAQSLMIQLLSMCTQSISVVGNVAGLLYLSRLAGRIPHASLRSQSRIVMWGYPIISGIGLVLAILAMLLMPAFIQGMGAGTTPTQSLFVFAGGGVFLGCISLIFYIWAIILFFRFRTAFRKAADDARTNWDAL